MPSCGTSVDIYNFGHYLDPYSRGILLDVKFKILENVKAKMKSKWENLEASSNFTTADTDEFTVDDPDELDPLEAMLNLREAQRNNAVESSTSPLELEFKKYESMPKTRKDVNPLTWWHSKKDELPLLFKIAQEVFKYLYQLLKI